MAPNRGLSTLCAIASVFYVSYALQRHTLLEQPRLAAFFVLGLSGLVSLGLSYSSRWLPMLRSGHGRSRSLSERITTSREGRKRGASQKESHFGLPKRPQEYFMPLLVGGIVLRVELLSRVNYDLQCSAPGIEYFLPLALLAYELLPGRNALLVLQPEVEEDDDMSVTLCDEIYLFLSSSRNMLRVGAILITWGAWRTAVFDSRSTFYCASTDWSLYILLLQWLGVVLDAAMIVVSWRLLSWVRITKGKLRTLGTILLLSSAGTLFFIIVAAIFGRAGSGDVHGAPSRNGGGISAFDVVRDGAVIATFIISTTLSLCDSDPVTLTTILVFAIGYVTALPQFVQIGEFTQASEEATALWTVYLLCFGFTLFVFLNQSRSIPMIAKLVILFIMTATVISVAVILFLAEVYWPTHWLEHIIYDARVVQTRWDLMANTSETLKVAVGEYWERNLGRGPPPGFDVWFQYAVDRNSFVIDQFVQITKDMWPFWGLAPAEIRRRAEVLSKEPDIVMVTIKDGVATHGEVSDPSQLQMVDGLIDLMRPFVQHLPDMQLPINMGEAPRVLTPWHKLDKLKKSGSRTSFSRRPGRRSIREEVETPESVSSNVVERADSSTPRPPGSPPPISAHTFRQMTALTCPPSAPARTGSYWNIRDFGSQYTTNYSRAQFLWFRGEADDICNQPDLFNLHEFFLTPPTHLPMQDLIPVFSRSKTSNYNDILIPLPRPQDDANDDKLVDPGLAYDQKMDRLFWRGTLGPSHVGHQILRGGQQARLAHLTNNASSSDKVTIFIPRGPGHWLYEKVPIPDINAALPFDTGISTYDCASLPSACASAQTELGDISTRPSSNEPNAALMSRYVALLDGASGPPRDLSAVLNSTSVPFVGSVFQEWFSERLMPWQHYVPLDLRFHALHSTLAYFTGLIGRGKVNGRERDMKAAQSDGKWIAEEGRRWSRKVLRREDEEIYLFRVLLEWGRLVSDDRERMVFKLEEDK